jgi:hypothetical protein
MPEPRDRDDVSPQTGTSASRALRPFGRRSGPQRLPSTEDRTTNTDRTQGNEERNHIMGFITVGEENGKVMSDELTNVQRLQHGLDLFLSKDMKAWTDLCAEDVVAEFPFAPEGTPSVIEGRAAFYEYLRGYPETIDVHEIPTTTIYTTGDPDVVVMEWSVAGTVVRTGNPYDMRYATFVTFSGGEITTYREYWNPQVFLAALGGQGF